MSPKKLSYYRTHSREAVKRNGVVCLECGSIFKALGQHLGKHIAYRNGGRIGSPRGGNMDCTMVAEAPVLPVGYVISASWIADRRIILAGYRLADLLTRVVDT